MAEMTQERIAFIVFDRDHALAVAEAAAETGVPVCLLSPPHGASILGADVFKAIVADARVRFPEADISAVLDCGDEPGTALGAVRHGIEAVSLAVEPEILERIADMASQSGTEVTERTTDAYDLSRSADPAADAQRWISKRR